MVARINGFADGVIFLLVNRFSGKFSDGNMIRDIQQGDKQCDLTFLPRVTLCSDRDRGVALVGASEKDSPIGGAVYTTVVNRVKHPDFDVETRENDILVMKLGGWVSRERFISGCMLLSVWTQRHFFLLLDAKKCYKAQQKDQ